jgi:glycosyltransferase involved in cell wall biosynthesis
VEAYFSRALGNTRTVDHFIAVSDFVREKVVSLGLPEERVSTVYNFLDPGPIVPAASAGDYLLYCGRLVNLKGLDTLLDAVKLLPKDHELHVVGTGEQELELRTRVEEEGLRQVRFLGFLDGQALDEAFRGARCVVIPSECYETFGLTALESFAHGRPVVATRMGGLPEVVTEGENGWLVAPRSPEALAGRLRWMMTHPAQAQLMGVAGRRALEERFSPQAHLRALSAVYEGLFRHG